MRKLIALFLVLTCSLAAQVAKKPSHFQPQPPRWDTRYPSGVWDAPRSTWDTVRESLFGQKSWKHFKITYPPLSGLPYCRVENMTHHLPYYFDHDPRNLVLTSTSLEFDAVAGDLIAWKVWAR